MWCRILRFPHIRRHTKSIHRVSHSGNIWYRLPANHRQYPDSRKKVLNFYIILEIVCIYDAGYCYPPISGHTPKHTLNISKRKYMIQTPDERSVTNTSEIYVQPTDTALWLYIVDVIRWRSFETHWGRVPHICVSKLTIIGSDTGLSPAWLTPSHYLNQCWNSVNSDLRNKLQWNLKRNSYIFTQAKAFENVFFELTVILSRGWGWMSKCLSSNTLLINSLAIGRCSCNLELVIF